MNKQHVTPDPGTLVVVPAGTLVQYEDVGIFINCNFNEPEFASQPYVTVNTEKLPPAHIDREGFPLIAVHLNDATLYDSDDHTGEPGKADAILTRLRAVHEASQGKGDQGAFDVWNTVAEILGTGR